jgi:hypothetical protein
MKKPISCRPAAAHAAGSHQRSAIGPVGPVRGQRDAPAVQYGEAGETCLRVGGWVNAGIAGRLPDRLGVALPATSRTSSSHSRRPVRLVRLRPPRQPGAMSRVRDGGTTPLTTRPRTRATRSSSITKYGKPLPVVPASSMRVFDEDAAHRFPRPRDRLATLRVGIPGDGQRAALHPLPRGSRRLARLAHGGLADHAIFDMATATSQSSRQSLPQTVATTSAPARSGALSAGRSPLRRKHEAPRPPPVHAQLIAGGGCVRPITASLERNQK